MFYVYVVFYRVDMYLLFCSGWKPRKVEVHFLHLFTYSFYSKWSQRFALWKTQRWSMRLLTLLPLRHFSFLVACFFFSLVHQYMTTYIYTFLYIILIFYHYVSFKYKYVYPRTIKPLKHFVCIIDHRNKRIIFTENC